MSRFPANTLTEKWWGKGQSPLAKQPGHTAGVDAGGGIALPRPAAPLSHLPS